MTLKIMTVSITDLMTFSIIDLIMTFSIIDLIMTLHYDPFA